MPGAAVKTMFATAVYVAADGDTRPVEADLDEDYEIVSISQRAGGAQPWSMRLRKNLSKAGRLRNLSITDTKNQQVEAWRLDDEETRNKPLFWGEFAKSDLKINAQGEEHTVHGMVVPVWHFGKRIYGQKQFKNGALKTVEIDLEFNPEIDGRIVENMLEDGDEYSKWIDTEATATDAAVEHTKAGATAERWELKDIVYTLCQIANPDEDFVTNPTKNELDEVFVSEAGPPSVEPIKVNNVILKRGQWLPDYLDAVLHPHGYNWYVKMEEDSENAGQTKCTIVVFQRGDGTEKTIKMQDVDSDLDTDLSQLSDLHLSVDLTTVRNKMRVDGALLEREMTIPLQRGYAADHNTFNHSKNTNMACRNFPANEAGDYIGMRAEITSGTVPDLHEKATFHRRQIEEKLAFRDVQRKSGRQPAEVENSTDGANWEKTKQDAWDVKPGEIGIFVSAEADEDAIPEVFTDPDQDFRITGVVKLDHRLTSEDDRTADSPVSHEVEGFVDASDRFFSRLYQTSGTYISKGYEANNLIANPITSDIRDDQDDLDEYTKKLAENERAAGITAEIVLHDILFDYEIGDILTKVEGREISFNRTTTGDPKYLQVVGIDWEFMPERKTTLIVDPYDV